MSDKPPRPKPPSIFEKPQEIGERLKEILKEENREGEAEKKPGYTWGYGSYWPKVNQAPITGPVEVYEDAAIWGAR